MEFLKITELMKEFLFIFGWNVKMCWISMFNLTKRVMAMYMPLLAKMVEDTLSIMFVKVNFEFFCDLNLFISLSYLLPMFETIEILIKFS